MRPPAEPAPPAALQSPPGRALLFRGPPPALGPGARRAPRGPARSGPAALSREPRRAGCGWGGRRAPLPPDGGRFLPTTGT